MVATFSLPILTPNNWGTAAPSLFLPEVPPRPRLPRVERVPHNGSLLHVGPMGDADVLSLNIAQGCAHRCSFCSARAYPSYPGDDVVRLFENTPERLTAELKARRKQPRAVYVSPSTDPFMPLVEVQEESARVATVLAEHGVEAWFMTRGFIRPGPLAVLAALRRVKVTVALTTLDRDMSRLLEPLAAPPRLRLRQIARLRQLGIPVQVELAPLVPGLTDTRTNLDALLAGLAAVGVERVAAGYMFLRPGIRDNLMEALDADVGAEVVEEYRNGPVLQEGNIAAARYLPKTRRQRGYAALMALAATRGIRVSVSGLTNPDFRTPPPPAVPQQRRLPIV